MAIKLTPKQEALSKRHETERQAPLSEGMKQILQLDTDFFEQYLNFSAYPWKKGLLPPKLREFLYIAIDATATHMYEPGLRSHIHRALEHGATKEEILEVLETISVVGIHSVTMGVPALAEEYDNWLAKKGKPPVAKTTKWPPQQEALIKRHEKERQAPVSPMMMKLLEMDPGFFEQYLNFSSYPWKNGVLPPKWREFIYIAIDATATHLYQPGLRMHVVRALEQGATKDEILDVLEQICALGIHACTVGIPCLVQEYDKWVANKAKK